MSRFSRPPPPPTLKSRTVPAPIGGINTVDVGGAMPAKDAVYLYNLIGAEYGLRSRLGYKEWCTGLTGAADNTVRSVLPFTGSHLNGTTNKLFACTQKGIYDVSASSGAPALLVTFGTQTGNAGYGVCRAFSTPAGRYLVYCDEENGLYVWSETGAAWTKVSAGTTQAWATNTGYAVGNKVVNGGNTYTCTTAGVSSASGAGPTGTGAGIVDGSVQWSGAAGVTASAIGPSLADQQLGYAGDPANFVFAAEWKGRLWFVEKDTSRAWYLSVNSIFGTATSFDFGAKMKAGGPLVGLYNWSYDAGSGMDSLLVGISTGGDVVIYQGTDPNSANTFMSNGCWSLGAVPFGRRIATDFGGDLLVLSALGAVPLSKLVVGKPLEDQSLYATQKISNLFNLLASANGGLQGWSIHVHPEDNGLLITVPSSSSPATNQLAMSFATKGWTQYRGLPMLSAAPWAGKLYFGTPDGRVCINTGYIDGVLLSNPNAFLPILFSGLGAFGNLGRPTEKRVKMVRPTVLSQTPNPLMQCTAKYGFDMTEPAPPAGAAAPGNNTWDNAVWDSSVWGGDYSPSQSLTGAVGMGRDVAIAFQGQAISRTVIVGFDVLYDEGGLR